MTEPIEDPVARANAVTTVAELAGLLRDLRRREARERRGRALTYQELADRTGASVASVGAYLAGMRVPPTDRFDELLRHLGARAHEQGPLATARDRVDDASRPTRIIAGRAAASANSPSTMTARMLPAAPRVFTGRTGALARLDGAAATTGGAGAVVVTAVAGMGGVGKTTLAVHWGHSTMEQFPDGQLYVNLRGYDPGEPLSTLDALGVLLSGLGTPPSAMPADEAGRHTLFRNVLSGRRALVLLDNVRSSAQVQPLLPPAPCLALITSRDDLSELHAEGEVRRVRLDVFAEGEAIALLRELIGARVEREPEAVKALAKRSGYLPLALRVLAELAASRPDTALSDLVDELESDFVDNGLDAFDTGDVRSDLRSVIDWSVRSLPDAPARALRLLGLVPAADVDEFGLAALADIPTGEAGHLLATLRRAHLVEAWPPGRYSMHDLIRAHAAASAERDLDAQDRRAALTRLLDYYLRGATVAAAIVAPGSLATGRGRTVPTGEVAVPDLTELGTAAAWLHAERANIVAACVYAARNGWPAHAVATAAELWAFLEETYQHDAITVHTAALAAADLPEAATDPRDRAKVLSALAVAHLRLGDLDKAALRAEESITVGDQAGDALVTRLGLTVLGVVHSSEGRFGDALTIFERVRDIGRGGGPAFEIAPLLNLGELNLNMERYEAAADCYREAATLAGAEQLRPMAAEAHRGTALALTSLGRSAEAVPIAERAVEVMREYGYSSRLVTILDTLARACRESGRLSEAIDHLAEAIEICNTLSGSYPASQILNTLGETYQQARDYLPALASHEEAVELAEQAGDRAERTRALVGLGDSYAGLGDLDRARELWHEALDHYTAMGLPAAARVEARLRDSP